jgi:xanthine dehydrogenase YagS FAD-binding subunit
MNTSPFTYLRATDEAAAIESAAAGATILAGGTNLVDMMRLGVMQPSTLVDVGRLPLARIEEVNGGLSIGAMARNSDVADHPTVQREFPVLSEALLSGTSAAPQPRDGRRQSSPAMLARRSLARRRTPPRFPSPMSPMR